MALGDKLLLLPLASLQLMLLMRSKQYALCNQMSHTGQARRNFLRFSAFSHAAQQQPEEPQSSRKQTAESCDARRLAIASGTR